MEFNKKNPLIKKYANGTIREKYSGWDIYTNRPHLTPDLIETELCFSENYRWVHAFIKKALDEERYELKVICTEPFVCKRTIPLESKDYYSLINEANDVLRGIFTEWHEYVEELISGLPEI